MIKLDYLNYKSNEKQPVVEYVFEDMQKNIVDGILFSGFKLTEQQLCEKYKISRTPIREVLRKLETKGLIEIIKNRGAFVRGFSRVTYMDMLKERKLLERLCLDLAIDRIDSDEMELLEENNDFIQFYYQTQDYGTLAKVFKGFHQIIYYSTYNTRLDDQMNFYYSCSNRKDALNRFYEEYVDDLYVYYSSIFACFKDKNKEKALTLMDKIMDLYIAFQTTLRI